jgi:CheY-like chemotaxis protein
LLTSVGPIDRRESAEVRDLAACISKPIRPAELYAALRLAAGQTGPGGSIAARPRRPAPLPRHPNGADGPRPLILLVEDSVMNQQVALALLEKLGYRGDAVANGQEALEVLGRIEYAAILMDCQMPEMDGFAASTEIRRREGTARHTPIIAMTANAMQGDRERCLAAGMDDFVSKPVRVDKLEAALRRWISDPRAAKRLPPAGREQPAPPGLAADAAVDPAALAGLRALQQPGQPDILGRVIRIFWTIHRGTSPPWARRSSGATPRRSAGWRTR